MAKIGIPIMRQNDLEDFVVQHFGKAPYYIIIELEDDKIKSWDVSENPAAGLDRKRGVKIVEFMKSRGANVVIVGEIGEGPFHTLRDSFMKMLQMLEAVKDVEKVVGKISELSTLTSPTK
ncbi:NifB/NifX family molybdenum-iron cluster-binding protein [Methanococcoides methylutens]|uniref:NifB/NifX family molybdenum-iron cluster-binding protein n=1 Tax=Methanococcoides methylutens TaxID=2226 RepID=UPI004043EC07